MKTITLHRQQMLDVLYESDDVVQDTIVGTSRWSIRHHLVFKYEGKLYAAGYSKGATENQDEQPWRDQDEVECAEVCAVERKVVVFEPVP